jgi:hypothetical protein
MTFYKNGAQWVIGSRQELTTGLGGYCLQGVTIATVGKLAAGESVDVRVYFKSLPTIVTATIFSAGGGNQFSGFRVY